MADPDDLDEFAVPLTVGGRRVPAMPLNDEEALRRCLAEFDAVRARGAAEAAVTPLCPPRPSSTRSIQCSLFARPSEGSEE